MSEGYDRAGQRVKTYYWHNCERSHRNYRTLAQCIWPKAAWINGDGPYATVAYCRQLTVQLHSTRDSAEATLERIDRTACGGFCRGVAGHELIALAWPSQPTL